MEVSHAHVKITSKEMDSTALLFVRMDSSYPEKMDQSAVSVTFIENYSPYDSITLLKLSLPRW